MYETVTFTLGVVVLLIVWKINPTAEFRYTGNSRKIKQGKSDVCIAKFQRVADSICRRDKIKKNRCSAGDTERI